MEMPNQIPEETVRIFVEFSRLECAIKALLDLNGRFFGGEFSANRWIKNFNLKIKLNLSIRKRLIIFH